MKFRRGGMNYTARKAFKNALRVSSLKGAGYTGAAWPRKRGRAKTPHQQAIVDQFVQACAMIRVQDPAEQAYAADNSPGTLYMPRDIQMAAMFGVLTRVFTTDGQVLVGRRTLSASIQDLLDQISESPGDMVVRTADGWISLSPTELNKVLSSAGPGNVPYWQNVAALLPTIQELLDQVTADQGALLYRSGAAWTEIPAGTTGQHLVSQGATTAPIWHTETTAPTWTFDANFKETGTIVGLADIASGRLLANKGTTTAEPTSTTMSDLLDLNFGNVIGDIAARGPSGWTKLPPGSVGQVLVAQGTTALPQWQSTSPSGFAPTFSGVIFGSPNSSISVNTTANATVGQTFSFQSTRTIYALHWPMNSFVNGASYVAQVSALNASNVVQTVNNSNTIVATDTVAAMPRFEFPTPPVVNTGTRYALTISRIDSTGSVVLPIYHFGNSSQTVALPYSNISTGQNCGLGQTIVSVGATMTIGGFPRVHAVEIG